MRVLVACEFSGVVRDAFAARGHDTWSCDLLPTEKSGQHYQQDIMEVIGYDWDLMIAHPPCTYLANSGVFWFYHPDDKHLPVNERRAHPRYPDRRQDQQQAIEFFIGLHDAPIEKIAIENPVGVLSTIFRKPDQIVHPYMFGHEMSKATCLWLKNLPKIVPTSIVGKGDFLVSKSGKRGAKWNWGLSPSEDRWKIRSRTFQGIADAMAGQWG